jgi:MFS family permease
MNRKPAVWKNPKLWALGIGQTLCWASLFYIFPALLVRWEGAFDWNRENLTFAFSGALFVASLAGVLAGRIIDQGKSHLLLSGSAVLGAILLAGLPYISTLLQFYLIWLGMGLAMAGCLYEPCFAYLTRRYQKEAKRPIVMITLMAGFAGTICFPIANAITDLIHWQASVWLFAASTGFIAAPLLWYGSSDNATAEPQRSPSAVRPGFRAVMSPVLKRPGFWALATLFASVSINHGMIISHSLPLIESRGVQPHHAIAAASFIGVAQIIGRLVVLPLEKHTSLVSICAMAVVSLSVASGSLALAGYSIVFLGIFILLQGASVGIESITKPLITAQMLGRDNFGTVSAFVSIFFVWGFALAPALGGIIWASYGYDALFIVTISLGLIGLISLLIASRTQSQHQTDTQPELK